MHTTRSARSFYGSKTERNCLQCDKNAYWFVSAQALFQQPAHPWPFLNAPKLADATATTSTDNNATGRLPRAFSFGGLADSPAGSPGSSQRVRASVVEVTTSVGAAPATRYESVTVRDFQRVRVSGRCFL